MLIYATPLFRLPRFLVVFGLLALLATLAPPVWAQSVSPAPAPDTTWAQLLVGVAGAPVVAALVSALVKPLTADARFYPPAAIVLGIAFNLLLAAILTLPFLVAVVYGILSGLAAAGLYSGGKTLLSAPPP